MPEKTKTFVITVTGLRYDGGGGSETFELKATAENRKAIQAYQANPNRTNLRRLFDLAGSGPTADLIRDGWVVEIEPPD
jgi:hypothetical protein